MTKKEFCNYIEKIRKAFDFDVKCDEMSVEYDVPFVQSNVSYLAVETVELLERIFGCYTENGTGDISYFCFELDFGRNYNVGDVKGMDYNGNEINVDFSSAEKLYDYLTSEG